MANTYFQFRQFRIEQERCAMKVGTDGVLLGSWVSMPESGCILDIGTGTGLIALMAAQRTNASVYIKGVELDKMAAQQAKENVKLSPWSERIQIMESDILDFETELKFDCIVSNPPYFQHTKPQRSSSHVLARHTDSLSFELLIEVVNKLLKNEGVFALVIPAEAVAKVIALAGKKGLHVIRYCRILGKEGGGEVRRLMEFSRIKTNCLVEELAVRATNGAHAAEYKKLTRAFYLNY